MPTTFANTIDGNEILAKRSQCDYAGNDIATTYATKGEIPSVPVTDVEVDGVSVVSSGVASITMPTFTQAQANWNESDTSAASYIQNKPSIPSATSDLTNDSGFITLSDVPAQVNADWNSSSGASEILNKPTIPSGTQLVPAATSADADKVLTVDSQGTPAWASAQAPISAGNGIDITNNVVSVDTSVVATQTDLADKEDAFDVGTGLEMDTSGATPTLQVEAPVDIVAGPGIAIDNPDGNTLRVSTSLEWQDKTTEITSAKTGTKLLYMPATGLCLLTIVWTGSIATANSFGTLSSAYRPSTSIIAASAFLNSNAYCRGYVESNGNISLSAASSATNVGVRITAIWVAGK